MKLTLIGHDDRYAVEQLQMALFPAGAAVEAAGRDLTDEEREIFYRSLDSITANLRILSKDGIPQE